MIRKTYIPAKPRNKKLTNVSGGGVIGRTDFNQVAGSSHEHPNKVIIDQILQQHLDVLGVLSIVDGNLKIDASAYSTGELSAYGIGSGGSGVDLSKLLSWAGYTSEMADYYAPASLLVPFRDDTLSRLASLEAGGVGGGSTVTWGAESGGYIPLTVEGVSKSVALSTHTHSQYALTTHDHSGVYEPVFSKNTAFNKDFGTTSGTVAQGNDSRIVNGQTAYGWGNHASAGYALTIHTHSQYALTTHDHSGVYAPVTHNHSGVYAPVTHNHSGVYEPSFSKNTAFNKNFGTTSGTVAQGNDSRIVNGQTAYGWGNHASAGYVTSSALDNYAPVTHNHSGVYEPVFSKNTAFNKAFGTTSGTVAQGNDSRIVNGQTAYGWGNHASAGYALSSELANYVTLATSQTISGAKTFSANLTASVSVTTPKVIFSAAGWSLEQVGTELQMKHNGVVKQRMLSDGSIVATGEVTAFVAAT